MRYTRYDYNKKKKNPMGQFILSMIGVALAAIVIGVGIAWAVMEIIPTNNLVSKEEKPKTEDVGGESAPIVGEEENESKETGGTIITDINTNFSLIQCGVFSSKESANITLAKLSSQEGAFITEDGGQFKVFAGVYKKEGSEVVVDELKGKEIDSFRVNCLLDKADVAQSQIAAIANGYLDILNTTFDDDVKSVDTTDFKAWSAALEVVSEGNNIEVLNELKEHIKSMPEQISKSDITNEMSYLYSVLNKFKQ